MDRKEVEQIVALIRREVVPAIGCTEPAAVFRRCTGRERSRWQLKMIINYWDRGEQ